MMKRRRIWPVATVLAVAMWLSGCTGSSDAGDGTGPTDAVPGSDAVAAGAAEWRRSVQLESLTVPEQMSAAGDRFDLGGMIAASGERPAVLAAVGTRPGGERYLRMSVWDGTAWQNGTIEPGVAGSAQQVALAGNALVTALAGWTWESGATRPFLLTSADRRSWTRIPLPDGLAGFRIVDVDVDESRVVALAQDARGSAATISLDRSGMPTVNPLPEIPSGQDRTLTAIAAAGPHVVIAGVQGPDRTGGPKSFGSIDGGRTWSEATSLSSRPDATVSGITRVPSGFVATGAEPTSGEGRTGNRATAWHSTDALTWTTETLPEADGFRMTGDSTEIGGPTAVGDYVLAVASSTSSLSARLFQRQPAGEWIDLGASDRVAGGAGFGGLAVPMTEPADGGAPGASFIAIQGDSGLTVGEARSGLWRTLSAPIADTALPFFQRTQSDSAESWRVTIRQRHLEPYGDGGWLQWWEPTEAGLAGDAVTFVPWDPVQLAGSSNVNRSSSGEAEVALASGFTADRKAVTTTGWFRRAKGRPWTAVTGFGTEQWEQVRTVDHLGDRWFAAGMRRPSFSDGHEQAMMWTSADGLTWARTDGDFAQEDRGSTIGGVCAGPDGVPTAVGSVTGADGHDIGALWIEQGGRWQRTELPADPGRDVRFSTCGVIGDAVVIDGGRAQRNERWSWSVTKGFASIEPPAVGGDAVRDPGAAPRATTPGAEAGSEADSEADSGADRDRSELRHSMRAADGFIASGRVDAAAYTGPVVWLSKDGHDWVWMPIPVTRPEASVLATVVDRDVIALSSTDSGSQAWRIRDIASVIAAIPTQA